MPELHQICVRANFACRFTVPGDHLLRKIDATIDFGFIREMAEGLYCPDNRRPPIAPEMLFKALFVGYLFGIRSER